MIALIGFRNLFRNLRRSLTVILAIAFGISALFIFHGFNTGTANQYREDMIHSRYGHGQIFTAGYREGIHEKPWQHWISAADSRLETLRRQPFVKHVFPRIEFYGLISTGSKSVSARGQAVDGIEEAKFFTTLNITQGKTLSDQKDGVLLGIGIAQALNLKPGDSVSVLSNTIHGTISGLDLVVTGIFHTGVKEFDDTYFRIPLEQGFQLLDTRSVESVALAVHRLEDWDVLERYIAKEQTDLEAVSFAVLDKVYYQHTVDWLEAQFQFIQAIIIFIVFLGILNTVSSAILERKQEIGNLRANGQSVWDVFRLLLSEGFFLGVIGSVVAIALSYFLTATLFRHGIEMPPGPGQTRAFATFIELQPDMALRAFLFGTGAAILGTCIAGLKVLTLPIGKALRSI